MTKIVILDQKLIVPNDYQQFWVHFDWFLSLFQISDVKYLFSLFKLKVRKNRTFWSRITILVILASKKAKKTIFMIRKLVPPTTKML